MKKRIFLILLAAISVTTILAQGRKELRFNEVMMINDSSYIDQYGRHDAWIEVFNRSYGTVGMEQMFISNKEIDMSNITVKPKDFLNDYAKKNPDICYEIPRGDRDTKIAPRTHVVFFADGNTAAGALHLSYKLDPAQENSLYLYDVNGDLVDIIKIPANMEPNTSYALKKDGDSKPAVFDANDWSMRDGSADSVAITPCKFNVADENDNIEAFHQRDPNGFIIALMAMSVVFSALLILYICFKLFGKFFGRKKEEATAGDATKTAAAAPAATSSDDEAIAAIGMALFQHLNAHDQESGVITIDHGHEAHSSWSSKISAMGQMPIHKN